MICGRHERRSGDQQQHDRKPQMNSQVIERAKNVRNKPGDKLRNEVGTERKISVRMDWEILRKWAKRLSHPWESSVRLTHACCVIRVKILIIFILTQPCQLLYSALLPPLEFMLSCFSCVLYWRFKHTHSQSHTELICRAGSLAEDTQIITHSQNTHQAHSIIKICCVEDWHFSGGGSSDINPEKEAVFALLYKDGLY